MPRPSLANEKRRKLLPLIADAFAEVPYRRMTTAELARRCGVQENILYRLWADKKAMFIAAIEYVFESSREAWSRVLKRSKARGTPAEKLLAYEAQHHGEFGRYRVLFAGLGETDDPEIRAALADTYARYQRSVRQEIEAHRDAAGASAAGPVAPDPERAAWAVVALGILANIGRELGLLSGADRQALFETIGRLLLDGAPRRT
jgi:AcrR family transcriptional regulator